MCVVCVCDAVEDSKTCVMTFHFLLWTKMNSMYLLFVHVNTVYNCWEETYSVSFVEKKGNR